MSRIGKVPVEIPSGVEVSIDGTTVKVKGKKGELTRTFQPSLSIVKDGDTVVVTPLDDERETNAFWGLTRTLINNMIIGVSQGFEKKLELVGVGYRASLKGRDLELQLGFSHPVLVKAPEGITFEVPSQSEINVLGASKEQVGQVAADIRKWRKPEPYKGKGIRYVGEHVRRKAGKAGKEYRRQGLIGERYAERQIEESKGPCTSPSPRPWKGQRNRRASASLRHTFQ